jgi:hypothetical protein
MEQVTLLQWPLNVIYTRVLRGHCSTYQWTQVNICYRFHTWFLLNSRDRLFPRPKRGSLAYRTDCQAWICMYVQCTNVQYMYCTVIHLCTLLQDGRWNSRAYTWWRRTTTVQDGKIFAVWERGKYLLCSGGFEHFRNFPVIYCKEKSKVRIQGRIEPAILALIKMALLAPRCRMPKIWSVLAAPPLQLIQKF